MPRLVLFLSGLLCMAALSTVLMAVETITFRNGDQQRTEVGKILIEAQDGGVMLQADDGHIWTLQPENIVSRESSDADFESINADEMERRLLEQMSDDDVKLIHQNYRLDGRNQWEV